LIKNFKDVFIELLQKNNVTAYDLHKSTSISQGLLSDYKKGRSTPTSENLIKIADYFGVSIDYLLGHADAPVNTINGDVSGSAFVQGVNNGTVSLDSPRKLTDEETELLKIFSKLDVKSRHKLLALAFSLDEEKK
jgi:transcriptional regulator with XRE-family HTH domain